MGLILTLSACSPGDGPPNIKDIGFDGAGNVVLVDVAPDYYSDEVAGENIVAESGQVTEACLADGTCIRLIDERQIDESTDDWATSKTVWKIDPNASWWDIEYGEEFAADVGVFDIVVLPDQSVLVAAGHILTISRGVDGQWSPSAADLRTLDKTIPGFATVVAALVLVAAGLTFGPEPRFGRWAMFLLLPMFVTLLFMVQSSRGLNGRALVVLFYPLALCGSGVLAGALLRTRHEDGFVRRIGLPLLAAPALLVVGWALAYVLWSRAMLSWGLAGLLCLVLFAAVAFGVSKVQYAEFDSGPSARIDLPPTSWSIRPWAALSLSLLVSVASPILGIFVGGNWLSFKTDQLTVGSALALLVSAIAVSHVRYQSPPNDAEAEVMPALRWAD